MSWLVDPLALPFFVRALAAAVLVLLAGAAAGFSVVLRRQSYLGQGVGQAMIAGVAIGATFDLHPTASALFGALAATLAIAALSRVRSTTADAAIAMVATSAFAIGVVVISSERERSVNLSNVLFGNVLGVSVGDLVVLLVVAALAWVFTWRTGRSVALAALAPSVAIAHGIEVRRLELARMVVLALVIASSVQVVGVTLVVAALVFPVATAMRWSNTLAGIHGIAAGLAVLIGAVGMYVSYWLDLASGPAVISVAAVGYLLTVVLTAVRR